jgi:hypothetical protein
MCFFFLIQRLNSGFTCIVYSCCLHFTQFLLRFSVISPFLYKFSCFIRLCSFEINLCLRLQSLMTFYILFSSSFSIHLLILYHLLVSHISFMQSICLSIMLNFKWAQSIDIYLLQFFSYTLFYAKTKIMCTVLLENFYSFVFYIRLYIPPMLLHILYLLVDCIVNSRFDRHSNT